MGRSLLGCGIKQACLAAGVGGRIGEGSVIVEGRG